MLLELYKLMLETASKLETPEGVTTTYVISKKKTKDFWEDTDNKKQHEILLDEWDYTTENGSTIYTTTLFGSKFSIKFIRK